MWVRTGVEDRSNTVEEIFSQDPTGAIFSGFKVYKIKGPLTPYVVVGYTVDDTGNFAPPSVKFLVDQLLAVTAAKRWRVQETGSVEYNGVRFLSDPVTRTNISQSLQVAERMERQKAGSFTTRWKTPNGTFVSVSFADVETVGMMLAAFIQAQFSKEDNVIEAVSAAADNVSAKLGAWNEAMETAWPVADEDTIPASEFGA